jgi:hypothetical protein
VGRYFSDLQNGEQTQYVRENGGGIRARRFGFGGHDFMLTRDPVVKISFLSLTSLTLKEIRVSGADLYVLLLACPELQFLSLTNVFDICSSESGVTLEFTSFSLKVITLKG